MVVIAAVEVVAFVEVMTVRVVVVAVVIGRREGGWLLVLQQLSQHEGQS